MALNYPQYQVQPFTYSFPGHSSSGFLLLFLTSPTASWQPATNMAQLLAQTPTLQAAQNLPAYPFAYVTGNGTANTWNGAAAAQAAAQADYTTITAARDTAAAQAALGATLPNAYVALGTAVSGPG